MLGQRERVRYLHIAGGKIVCRTETGQNFIFDYVEGVLEDIYLKEREFRGERIPYWHLNLRDSETGELYILGVSAVSGVWRALILSLGSCSNFLAPLRIVPWMRGNYNRVTVYSEGEKLPWIDGLPEVEEVTVGARTIKDTSKREIFYSDIVDRIQTYLGK